MSGFLWHFLNNMASGLLHMQFPPFFDNEVEASGASPLLPTPYMYCPLPHFGVPTHSSRGHRRATKVLLDSIERAGIAPPPFLLAPFLAPCNSRALAFSYCYGGGTHINCQWTMEGPLSYETSFLIQFGMPHSRGGAGKGRGRGPHMILSRVRSSGPLPYTKVEIL